MALSIKVRANMAHLRQTRPDSGLGFQVQARTTFEVVPFLLYVVNCSEFPGWTWRAPWGGEAWGDGALDQGAP